MPSCKRDKGLAASGACAGCLQGNNPFGTRRSEPSEEAPAGFERLWTSIVFVFGFGFMLLWLMFEDFLVNSHSLDSYGSMHPNRSSLSRAPICTNSQPGATAGPAGAAHEAGSLGAPTELL